MEGRARRNSIIGKLSNTILTRKDSTTKEKDEKEGVSKGRDSEEELPPPVEPIEKLAVPLDDTVVKRVDSVELESRKWKEEVLLRLQRLEDKIMQRMDEIEEVVDDVEGRINVLETQIAGPFLNRFSVVEMHEAMQQKERRKKNFKEFQLISVCKEDTVEQVLKVMAEHTISSVPILNDNNEVIGSVDVLDFVTFIITKFALATPESPRDSRKHQQEQFEKSIADLPDISGRNPCVFIKQDTSLMELLRILSEKNTHRVFVRKDSQVVGIITQFSLIEFLNAHKRRLDRKLLDTKVWTFSPLRRDSVNCLETDQTVKDALIMIWEKGITGIGLVEKGVLVGTVSADDIVLNPLGEETSTTELLNMKLDESEVPTFEPQVAYPKNTLSEILSTLAKYHLHRIFVVDDKKRPVGVLTLTSIIKFILESVQEKEVSNTLPT